MKTDSNLPEPTFNDTNVVINFKSTLQLISNVLKLTKKIFML